MTTRVGNILSESRIEFRKYLILKLAIPIRQKGHYYIFLTDAIRDSDNLLKFMVVSISSTKPKNKNTHDKTYVWTEDDEPIHPCLTKEGFVEFKAAELMLPKKINKLIMKNYGYEKTNASQVDEILALIPNSKADKDVRDFYDKHIKN